MFKTGDVQSETFQAAADRHDQSEKRSSLYNYHVDDQLILTLRNQPILSRHS